MNDYLNRMGRPAQVANGGGPEAPAQHPAVGGPNKKRKIPKPSLKMAFMTFLVCIVILLVALVVYVFVYKDNTATMSQVKIKQYQAVFLNSADGQVYFGKLTSLNRNYYKLTDIYYVRVQTVQPDKNSTATTQNISLAKLGNEIHGPEDVMYINKSDVMFWENLKESGQVVTAIRAYQKSGGQTTNTTPTTNTTTNTTNTTTNTTH